MPTRERGSYKGGIGTFSYDLMVAWKWWDAFHEFAVLSVILNFVCNETKKEAFHYIFCCEVKNRFTNQSIK